MYAIEYNSNIGILEILLCYKINGIKDLHAMQNVREIKIDDFIYGI